MGTKERPGKHDAYTKANLNEPLFTLIARDPMASILVDLWADIEEHKEGNTQKVAEARSCAASMRRWRAKRATAEASRRRREAAK